MLRALRVDLGEARFRAFVAAVVDGLAGDASPAERARTVETVVRRVARLRL